MVREGDPVEQRFNDAETIGAVRGYEVPVAQFPRGAPQLFGSTIRSTAFSKIG
jgi:hypothetical protein